MCIQELHRSVAHWLQVDEGDVRLIYDGARLDGTLTVADYSIENSDVIHYMCAQLGGKPVIYLFPRKGTEVQANVSLTLSEAWSFSALYPVAPLKERETEAGGGQEVVWSVVAKDDGTLHDERTGSDVAYLFWEAE